MQGLSCFNGLGVAVKCAGLFDIKLCCFCVDTTGTLPNTRLVVWHSLSLPTMAAGAVTPGLLHMYMYMYCSTDSSAMAGQLLGCWVPVELMILHLINCQCNLAEYNAQLCPASLHAVDYTHANHKYHSCRTVQQQKKQLILQRTRQSEKNIQQDNPQNDTRIITTNINFILNIRQSTSSAALLGI